MSQKKILLMGIALIIISFSFILRFTLSQNKHNYDNHINFIDEEVFEIIKEAYAKVDFFGEFKKGDIETYACYKEQYLKLLKGEVTFFDPRTQKEYYIYEFGEMNYTFPDTNELIYGGGHSDTYDPNNYIYYFFDMDDDRTPEICVTNEIRFNYIFKYKSDTNSFLLWHEDVATLSRLLGSKKFAFYNGNHPAGYRYYELDLNGKVELAVEFEVEEYFNPITEQADVMYRISFPQYADKTKNIELSDKIKKKAVRSEYNDSVIYDLYYFRVSKEQWEELTNAFFNSRKLSEVNIKEVSFTYRELFPEPQNIENPYFFKQGTTKQLYSCTYDDNYSDYYIDATIEVTLHINKISEIDDGILYQLKIEPVLYYNEERMILGYFYVQEDIIYKITTEDIDINEFKTKNDIIANSDIVCQVEEIKDSLNEDFKGWHNCMIANGDTREYHQYNNAVETGYYEQFIWEYGKGLVAYRSGWGAESRPIDLQIINN